MRFQIGDMVKRKPGFSGEGLVGEIVEFSDSKTAVVRVGERRHTWYISRIEHYDESEFEVDE